MNASFNVSVPVYLYQNSYSLHHIQQPHNERLTMTSINIPNNICINLDEEARADAIIKFNKLLERRKIQNRYGNHFKVFLPVKYLEDPVRRAEYEERFNTTLNIDSMLEECHKNDIAFLFLFNDSAWERHIKVAGRKAFEFWETHIPIDMAWMKDCCLTRFCNHPIKYYYNTITQEIHRDKTPGWWGEADWFLYPRDLAIPPLKKYTLKKTGELCYCKLTDPEWEGTSERVWCCKKRTMLNILQEDSEWFNDQHFAPSMGDWGELYEWTQEDLEMYWF